MEATCESCGNAADVRLLRDDSTWCAPCDVSARNLGYDNEPYEWIGAMNDL